MNALQNLYYPRSRYSGLLQNQYGQQQQQLQNMYGQQQLINLIQAQNGLVNLADTVKAGTSEHEGMTIDKNYYNLKDGAVNKNGGYMNIFGSLQLLVWEEKEQ